MLAGMLGGRAEVTLRRPPPLGKTLDVARDGDAVRLLDGDTLVAEAIAVASVEVDVPDAISVAEAEEGARAFPLDEEHPYSTCFVCGVRREAGDGLRIHPGPVPGRDLVGAPWTPDAGLAAGDGQVRPEFVWAALDCPSGLAVNLDADNLAMLGRYTVTIVGRVAMGRPYAIAGWRIASDGRKEHSAAALFTEEGEVLAYARSLWIRLAT